MLDTFFGIEYHTQQVVTGNCGVGTADIAQIGRASVVKTERYGFDSRYLHHYPTRELPGYFVDSLPAGVLFRLDLIRNILYLERIKKYTPGDRDESRF